AVPGLGRVDARAMGDLVAVPPRARHPARDMVRLFRRPLARPAAADATTLLAREPAGAPGDVQRISPDAGYRRCVRRRTAPPLAAVAARLSEHPRADRKLPARARRDARLSG